MSEKHYRIPPPPGRPRYREYAAGSVGDYRPYAERLTERILTERSADSAVELRAKWALDPPAWQALAGIVEDAFRAGRAWQLDHPERTDLEDGP